MAKKKNPRTRFVIFVEGQPREFLSVEDRPDGSLLLLTRGGDRWGEVVDQPHEPKNIHYSVHPSRNNPAFLIKETVRLSETQLLERVAFVKPGPNGLVAPLKIARSSDLRISSYIPDVRVGDQLVTIGSFDPAVANLVFFIVVTERNGPWPALFHFPSVRRQFSDFSVLVYYYFTCMPSLGYSYEIKMFSGGASVNKEAPAWRMEGGVDSLSDDGLADFVHATIPMLMDGYLHQLEASLAMSGLVLSSEQRAETWEALRFCLPYPPDDVRNRQPLP